MAGDVNFDHLVEVLSTNFCPCKVTGFSFAINKDLEGESLRLRNSLFLIILSSTVLASIMDPAYDSCYCDICQRVVFYFHCSFYIY